MSNQNPLEQPRADESGDMDSAERIAHERRVQNVLIRARQEIGVRDLISFSLGRMWSVLLSLGAVVYALIAKKAAEQGGSQSDTTDQAGMGEAKTPAGDRRNE
jgi:hypothetical protein